MSIIPASITNYGFIVIKIFKVLTYGLKILSRMLSL